MRYRNVVRLAVVGVLLLVAPSVSRAVTYGDPVDEPSITHPEVVPVWVGRDGMCSGTLIDPVIVLTAAHCVYGYNNFQIEVGGDQLETGDRVGVVAQWYHPRFDRRRLRNDIALLHLNRPVDVGQLAVLDPTIQINNNTRMTIAGWGDDQNGETTEYLQTLEVVQQTADAKKEFGSAFQPKLMIAAGYYFEDEDIYGGGCNGDSGGPLFIKRADGKRVVVGVTSYGSAEGCTDYKPTVFSRMSFYHAMVMSAMQSLKQKVDNSPIAPPTSVPPVVTTSVPSVTTTSIPTVTTTVPLNPTPTNLQPPTISGNPNLGETWRCEKGTWSPAPSYFNYAWYGEVTRNGSIQKLLLGSGETFYLSVGYDGYTVFCEVSASRGVYQGKATSQRIELVFGPRNLAAPEISGVARVGERLTCTRGSWSPDARWFSYRWYYRAGSGTWTYDYDLSRSDYVVVPTSADGKEIYCEVTARNTLTSSKSRGTIAIGVEPIRASISSVVTWGGLSQAYLSGVNISTSSSTRLDKICFLVDGKPLTGTQINAVYGNWTHISAEGCITQSYGLNSYQVTSLSTYFDLRSLDGGNHTISIVVTDDLDRSVTSNAVSFSTPYSATTTTTSTTVSSTTTTTTVPATTTSTTSTTSTTVPATTTSTTTTTVPATTTSTTSTTVPKTTTTTTVPATTTSTTVAASTTTVKP